VQHPDTWQTGLLLWVVGCRGRMAQSRSWRFFTHDRSAARSSAERILAWDFRRIVMGHGEVVEGDARPALGQAMQRMGKPRLAAASAA
jgi:hypothetical protein